MTRKTNHTLIYMKGNTNTGYEIFLSAVAAIGGILFGYDTAVISGTISSVAGQFSLNTINQGWYVGCALIGSIAGVSVAGILSDRIGRKITMLTASVLFFISAAGCAFCGNFTQLVIFRIIGGAGIGIVSIVSPIYISEVASAERRGTLVSCYQLAITVGFLLAYLVNYKILDISQTSSFTSDLMDTLFISEYWRGMLGSGVVPAALFFMVIFIIPESPRWMIVHHRGAEARIIMSRIYSSPEAVETQYRATESSIASEVKSEWKALLSPGIMKAVIVGCAIAILGQFMGVNAVLYYGPEIFGKAGLGGEDALLSQVLVGAVNMLTTVIALFIIDRVGRKQLVYWGVSGMIISLLMIGLYFSAGESWNLGNSFLLAFFLFYVFCCAISISAVVFVLLSEMYPNSVRGIAMSIAGMALWIGTYLIGQLTPWLLENLSPAGTFFLFALMCVPYLLIMWKAVPETTGKTLEEIENYWKGSRN